MIEVYKLIRKYRTAANLTQADIAEVCGVTRNAVTQWESLNERNRTEPSIADLEKIARLCDSSLSEMFADSEIDQVQEDQADYIASNKLLTKEEQKMLADFRKLDTANRKFLLKMLENLKV